MNIYTCTSANGMWPVGFAAVIVADSQELARQLLARKIRKYPGLNEANPDIENLPLDEVVEVSMDSAIAIILVDGDY